MPRKSRAKKPPIISEPVTVADAADEVVALLEEKPGLHDVCMIFER